MRVHPSFRLNGTVYDQNTLLVAAQQWATATDLEQKGLGIFLMDWLGDAEQITLQTSGSTGKPKAIQMPKTALRASAMQTGSFFELSAGDTALLCLPVQYIAGKMMVVRALVLGLALDILPPTTQLTITKTYDFAALIPLQVMASFEQLGRLNKVLIGGAPISAELRKSIAQSHVQCTETYGMTETLTHVATRPVTDPMVPFQALPGIGINTDDNDCLVLEVPYVSNAPIVTQDVVRLHGKDSFWLLGRRDWVINSGGKKVFPEQLEERLGAHLNHAFFFTGIADANLGQKLVLVAEAPADKATTILRMAQQHLGADKHHVPKQVICLDAFVLTPSGKLDRQATLKTVNIFKH